MRRHLAAFTVLSLFATLPAAAHETTSAADRTSISIAVSKANVVRLQRDAGVVLVAKPEIADVAIESPRLIFVIGRNVGETNLYVFDGNGREMVNADVVVIANPERHVTVHRAIKEHTFICAPRCAQVVTPGAVAPTAAGRNPPQAAQ